MNGPPKYIELLVEWLTPPACREHVLGDLRERYQNPARYLLDALSTLPLVIASRIRRTTDSRMLALEIGAIAAAFAAAAMVIMPFVILAGLAGLRLAAAYTPKPLIQVFSAFAAMQLAHAAYPVLPRDLFLTGVTYSLLLLATLRTLWPEQPAPAAAGVDELRARALGFEKSIRRRNFREHVGAAFVVAFFAWRVVAHSGSIPRYGPAAMIAVAIYTMIQLRRPARSRKAPSDAPLPVLLDCYHQELLLQRRWYSRAFWRPSPLTSALIVILAGAVFATPQFALRLPLLAAPMLLFILIASKWNHDVAGRLDQEIDRVESARSQL